MSTLSALSCHLLCHSHFVWPLTIWVETVSSVWQAFATEETIGAPGEATTHACFLWHESTHEDNKLPYAPAA